MLLDNGIDGAGGAGGAASGDPANQKYQVKVGGAVKEYTLDELVALSGASIGTVKMQVNYLLPKTGKTVNKNVVDGVTKYSVK